MILLLSVCAIEHSLVARQRNKFRYGTRTFFCRVKMESRMEANKKTSVPDENVATSETFFGMTGQMKLIMLESG